MGRTLEQVEQWQDGTARRELPFLDEVAEEMEALAHPASPSIASAATSIASPSSSRAGLIQDDRLWLRTIRRRG
jgi:hypothetical protein